jgi:TATA-binding protein-associated factor Taf7
MLREIIQSQLPLLIIICLLTYLVYYLHKRILRIETYLKKLNENQLLQQKGIETTQMQVSQVAQAVEPVISRPPPVEPIIQRVEPTIQKSEPIAEENDVTQPVNNLFNLFSVLQQEMNNARQQHSKIEEINDDEEQEEDDDETDDDDNQSQESNESEESEIEIKKDLVMDDIDSESEESTHQEESVHEDEKPISKKNFNKMTVKELQAIATENGLNVMKKTRKELIAMLEEKAHTS